MKEETVATSINNIESYDPSSFVVEEYSEEVGSLRQEANTDELNIGQEVYIDQDHNTVTYEVRNIEEVPLFSYPDPDSQNNIETVVEDGELSLENVEEAVVYDERQFYSSNDTNRVSKAALKKRRGRPPKFQISEIGQDGRKWYSCSVCDEKHEDRMELMQHMRQHNADRPFHCKECGKAFKQAAHLKVHARQHTGEKPFECGICGKGFRQKAIVDQHMRTHTQHRPYACTYLNCDKSFAQKTSLDNHTKSHQTGRLSEAFKRQQEEQKKKSLLAQEALKNKNLKTKLVQVLPNGKKRPVHRVLGGALSVGKEKIKTTVVKMTQSQFEDYLHSRAGSAPEAPQISQKELTSKQKAATGPFLAYVNLCKPLLQSERPELSLLEVLKELASRWNNMNKPEKQKFAVIAKESEDKQEYNATTFVASEEFGNIIKSNVDLLDDAEGDVVNSMEGAVFEVGESSSGDFYQVDKQLPEETFFEIDQVSEKSLNQNVFGKKSSSIEQTTETFEYEEQQFSDQNFSVANNVFQTEDANMQVVEGFDDTEQILEQTSYQPDGTVVQFEGEVSSGDSLEQSVLHFGESSSNGTVVFDNGSDGTVVYGSGSEMEIGNSTIFFLPNIVGEEQLEQVM